MHEVLTKEFVKEGVSQLRKFSVNVHKFHTLASFAREVSSENAHECAQNAENGFGFGFFRAIPRVSYELLSRIVPVTCNET
jgi:hypothetical protein